MSELREVVGMHLSSTLGDGGEAIGLGHGVSAVAYDGDDGLCIVATIGLCDLQPEALPHGGGPLEVCLLLPSGYQLADDWVKALLAGLVEASAGGQVLQWGSVVSLSVGVFAGAVLVPPYILGEEAFVVELADGRHAHLLQALPVFASELAKLESGDLEDVLDAMEDVDPDLFGAVNPERPRMG